MRFILFAILCITISCKSNFKENKSATNDLSKKLDTVTSYSTTCDTQVCEKKINYYLLNFNPIKIDLGDCMTSSFNDFLLSIDTNCLRTLPSYKRFINGVLLKLYYHHLSCCGQGYDLLSMKEGGAKVLINEFQKINNEREGRDMLNSGTVLYFIQTDSSLKNDTFLGTWVKKIKMNKHYVE